MSFRFRLFISVLLLIAAANQLRAGESYNLYQVIKASENNSPLLRSTDEWQNSTLQQSRQSQKWNNPILTLDVGKEKDPMGRNQYLNVILAQPLYLPGTYSLREQLAKTQVKLGEIEKIKNYIDYKALVLRQYFASQIADQQLEHAIDRHRRYETVSTFLKTRPFGSPQQKIEVFNVAARILQRKTELSDSETSDRSAYARLSMLSQRSITVVTPKWIKKLPAINFGEIKMRLDESVSVKTTETQLLLERTQLSLLDKEKYGPITVTLTAQQFNGPSQQEVYAVGLIAPIPVFNRMQFSTMATESKVRSLESKLEFEKRQALQELQELEWKYESLQKKLDLLKVEEIEKLEKNIQISDVEFKKGRVDLITYLDFDDQHEAIFNEIMNVQVLALEFLINYAHLTHSDQVLEEISL